MGKETPEQDLHSEVRQALLDLIGRMNLSVSTRMLSEKQLAAKLQVSRATIRTVLADLEAEGKIIRRQGSGTYVNPQALHVKGTLYPLVNFLELIEQNGYASGVKILSVRDLPAGNRAAKMDLLPQTPITEITSIYTADGRPCMYCVDCVESERLRRLDWYEREQYDGSIYEFMQQEADVRIENDIINIRASHSGLVPELARVFSVPSGEIKPVVKLEMVNFDKNNHIALLGNIYVDCDLIQLNIVRPIG